MARAVAVTGASGLVGRQVVACLAAEAATVETVLALDLRVPPAAERLADVVYQTGDIRDPELAKTFEAHGIDTVVHLAAVVTPGRESSREREYAIDVLGTENVARACVAAGVRRLVYTSSGAAYGYHADSPKVLCESDPLRGNPDFAYADHKRLAEELLARFRDEHPELEQLIFRPGTILGERVASPISALFERPVIVGVRGSETPFVLVWDEDVAAAIVKGVLEGHAGIYNLAGNGTVSLREIARRLGKPYVALPPRLLAWALATLQRLGFSARGAEQLDFLRYRPVLSNAKLASELGFRPRTTSSGCFERYRRQRFPDSFPCQGLSVVLTGGGSGIGAALGRRLARAGARVMLVDREPRPAAELAAELQAEDHEVVALRVDVTDPGECARAMEEACKLHGGIDVLVNNAGITHIGRFEETEIDVLRRVLEVNLFGAVYCTKAALPALLARRGQVVAVGSVAGLAPLATRTGYAASKHAVHGFFESLRAEYPDGRLGVLLVDPGFVDTPIGDRALGPDGEPAGRGIRTGVRNPISPERAADAIFGALLHRRRHLFVPWRAGVFVWVSRLAPRFFERAMARRTTGDAD